MFNSEGNHATVISYTNNVVSEDVGTGNVLQETTDKSEFDNEDNNLGNELVNKGCDGLHTSIEDCNESDIETEMDSLLSSQQIEAKSSENDSFIEEPNDINNTTLSNMQSQRNEEESEMVRDDEESCSVQGKSIKGEGIPEDIDDESSIMTFTTLSYNPSMERELQKQIEQMSIMFQEYRSRENGFREEIRKLTDKQSELSIEVYRKEMMIEELKRVNEDSLETISSLRGTIDENRNCMEEQKEVSINQEFIIGNLNKQITELKEKVNQLKKEKKDESDNWIVKETEWKEINRKLNEEKSQMEQQNKEYEKEITQLNQRLEEFEKKDSLLRSCDSDDSFYSIEDIQDEPREIVVPLKTVALQVFENEEPVVLSLNWEENEAGYTLLQRYIEQLQSTVAEYLNTITEQGNQIESLKSDLQIKERNEIQLEEDKNQITFDLKQEEEQVEKLNNTIISLKTSIQEKDLCIETLNSSELNYQKQISELNARVSLYCVAEKDSKKTTEEKDHSYKALQESFNSKNKEIILLKSEIEKQKALMEATQSRYNSLMEVKNQKEELYNELSAEYVAFKETAKQSMQDMKLKMKNQYNKLVELARGEIVKRETRIQELTKKYQQTLSLLDSISHERTTVQANESTNLKLTIVQQEQEIAKLQKSLEKKTKTIDGLNDDLNKKEELLRSMYSHVNYLCFFLPNITTMNKVLLG